MAESSESIIRQLRASVEAAERKRDEFASSATLAADRANRNRAEVDRLASIIAEAMRVLRDRDTAATPDEYRQRAAGDASTAERYKGAPLLQEVLVERADRWRRLADLQELKALVKVPGEAIDWSHRLWAIECSERWARVASEDADEDGRDAVMSSPASPRRQASIHYHATQEAVMRELRAPHQRPDGTCVVLITERQRDADPRVIEARLAYDEADALLMGPVCELARQHDGGGAPQAAW